MDSLECKDDARRDAIRRHVGKHGQPNLNGLDYLEVGPDETTLTVYFLGKLPVALRVDRDELPQYVRIEGGRRIRDIKVTDVDPHREKEPDRDDSLTVTLDKAGDYSTYTLRLVGVPGIDPRYDHIDFSFKVDCPSTLDCAPADDCPPTALTEPDINYLAKDYASFRQLILDRLSLVMPDWRERHVPDIGIAVVEVLAYVGDYLSYYQDAVATEAYLDTARRRISVRRHARLVDYIIHEGANSRAWVTVETNIDLPLDPKATYFVTGLADVVNIGGSVLEEDDLRQIPLNAYEIFEPLVADREQPIQLYAEHSRILFYAWGNRECCLARGATSATLQDRWIYNAPPPAPEPEYEYKYKSEYKPPAPYKQQEDASPDPNDFTRALKLKVGDVLIFEEVLGAKTGAPPDADPARRHAVRLTRVEPSEDIVFTKPVKTGEHGKEVQMPVPLVEIEWAEEDALPFPLCVSAIGRAPKCEYLEPVSVARGNVILVDHGKTVAAEDLGVVSVKSTEAECRCAGQAGEVTFTPARFEPRLAHAPLTHSEPLLPNTPAASALRQDARKALPQVRLRGIPPSPDAAPLFEWGDLVDPAQLIEKLSAKDGRRSFPLARHTRALLAKHDAGDEPTEELRDAVVADLGAALEVWEARQDLLASTGDDRHFVVEVDDEGAAHLRFGDGELGAEPRAGANFRAAYRVGNGVRGNVGAEAILHLVLRNQSVSGASLRVRNPMPSAGGIDPEPLGEARLAAPANFRKQLARAVTASDYAQLTEREFKRDVQRAAAQLTWTGSWYEATVAVDAFGGEPEGEETLLKEIDGALYRYRRMGHDLAVNRARRVPLQVAFEVCVRQGYLRAHVEAALRDAFSNRTLSGGKRGFFHPDNLTFGQNIYLSRLVAAAHAVAGVESVRVTKLQRLFEATREEIENGVLPLGAFEVAQLDNDPNYPEHGRLTLSLKGGR